MLSQVEAVKGYYSQASLSNFDGNIWVNLLILLDRNKFDDWKMNEMIQHIIDLHDRKLEFGSVLYRRSPEDNAAIVTWVKELLSKDYI